MPDLPSQLAPQLPAAPVPEPSVVGRKRRRLLIVIIVALVLVVALLGAGALLLVQQSAPEASPPTSTLPIAAEQLTASPSPTSQPPPVIPAALQVSPEQNNLALTLTYTRTPEFRLQIAGVQRTIEDPTLAHYAPTENAPFSILRIKDPTGTILTEAPFAVTTSVEVVGDRVAPDGSSVYQLPQATIYIVVPVREGGAPATIELASSDGTVFATRTVIFNNLPKKGATTLPLQISRSGLGHTLRRLFTLKSSTAHAQQPGAGTFVIAVVAQEQGLLDTITNTVEGMVNTIEPWKSYAGQIKVAPILVPKDYDLKCQVIEGPSGLYPVCPNEAAVADAITGVDWNTIVVAWGGDCACGVVDDFAVSNIATVGRLASSNIVAHELGHSVGRMVDEYYYKLNIKGGPLGPNCFASEVSCQDALKEIGATATCSLGCRSVDSFRPSSELMHDWGDATYGPLETCIMAEQLRKTVGGPQRFGECTAPGANTEPSPPPARAGDYYGGRR